MGVVNSPVPLASAPGCCARLVQLSEVKQTAGGAEAGRKEFHMLLLEQVRGPA